MPVILFAIVYTVVIKNYHAWNLKQIFKSFCLKQAWFCFMSVLVEIVTELSNDAKHKLAGSSVKM